MPEIDQVQVAADIIRQFDLNGHEHDLEPIDIIDALASVGVEFREGAGAVVAYHKLTGAR
jgi:hypothetical protein